MKNFLINNNPGSGGAKYLSDKAWILLAVIVTIAVYIPAVNYDFLWDDSSYLLPERMVFSLANLRYCLLNTVQRLYSPVTLYSLMIDYNLFSNSPIAYHIHNLLLHCGSVLIFIAIMKKLRISIPIAAAVVILWSIHPQRVPSVVWISERKDVLVVFFAMASVYSYMAAYQKNKFSIMSPLFLVLSLGAKPSAIGLVAIMVVYTFRHKLKWQKVKLLVPDLMATGFYFCWFVHVNKLDNPVASGGGILQEIWIVIHNIMWYFCSGFIPFQLNPAYPRLFHPDSRYLTLFCGFILLLAVLCTAVFMVKRASIKLKIWFVTGMALCWGAIFLPVSGIYRIGRVDYADRYNYLLSAVAWVVVAILLRQTRAYWAKNNVFKKLIPTVFVVFLGSYWYMTWSYMPVWSNCENLYFRALQWEYSNPRAIENMGVVGVSRNNVKMLELASLKFLTLANAGEDLPFYPEQVRRDFWLHSGWFLKAYAMYLRGDRAAAFQIFLKLQKLAEEDRLVFYYKQNNFSDKLFNLLIQYHLSSRRPKEALVALECQLKALDPDSFAALFNKGLTAFIKKDYGAAEKYWKAAYAMRPDDKMIVYNLKIARARLNMSQGTPVDNKNSIK